MQFVPAPPVHRVLCADCGTPIEPNSANLCVSCLRNTVDITEGIPKQSSLSFCRNCDRFLSPPQTWTIAEPESRQLLEICLKKLKSSLNKVRLIDAGFIWTEPHSKRLKVKLTIQKEVFTSTVLQQIFMVEYVVQHGQCPDCTKLAAKNTWKALVQVRQKVPHKRTFLFLEQLILKHGATKDTISVKEMRDGLDFFYAQRSHAIKMVEFLSGVVPVRTKASEQLLSRDTHSNTANYKFSYSVEIAPICKDDFVCLPPALARSLGNINQLTVCTRVGNSIHLIDPATLQTAELASPVYFRTPFDALASVSSLVEFTVLDIEPTGLTRGKWVLADAQIALSSAFRSHDASAMDDDGTGRAGGGDGIVHTRTHLGGILHPGDAVLGYHVTRANYNSDDFSTLAARGGAPDVVLVRKAYPHARKKARTRAWRLRSIAKEAGDDAPAVIGRMGGRDARKVEEEYEHFLRDLEEDVDMRQAVSLFKAEPRSTATTAGAVAPTGRRGKGRARQHAMDVDDAPAAPAFSDAAAASQMDDDEEPEADFPDVRLDELLEDFGGLDIEDEDDDDDEATA